MDEAELIQSARQGDEIAIESLIQQHQQAVFRLAYLLLGDSSDADDVVQETFIRAIRALERFDATRPIRPWLLHIATNLARNHYRARSRYWAVLQRMVRLDPEKLAPAIRSSPPEDESQALWQTVRRLTPNDQEIIYLRYFLDLSEIETAEALGIAQGTVKSRLHRALNRLRDLMNAEKEGG